MGHIFAMCFGIIPYVFGVILSDYGRRDEYYNLGIVFTIVYEILVIIHWGMFFGY